ncbi:MAG TPA: glutathione peroxidase, partial [Gammaproteobacteria bacterium]|nr:glutathione peroxidase [Gammaproteobacteria bacterium]
EKMFIEPDQPGDPFEVSDADTLFEYLYGDAEKPLDVTLLTREGCPFCAKAKALLAERGIEYEALELNQDYSYRSLRALAAADSYPQVFINGEKIGGC